ncbi:MAG: HD-GYP domain-containing protein [Thermoleophilia bacterium]|nr:HD-GYP domain-containing protein [Thermoleophilia bacterium]
MATASAAGRGELAVYGYAAGLAAAAAATAVALVATRHGVPSPWALLPLVALGVAAERRSVSLSLHAEVSIALLPTLFAAVALGPVSAMIVAAGSMLGGFRAPYLRWAVYTSASSVNGAIAGLVAGAAATATTNGLGSIAVATAAAGVSAQAVDVVFAVLTLLVRRSASAMELLRLSAPALPSSVLLYTAVVAPVVYAYLELSPWTLLLFLLPALAAQRLWAMYQEQRRLASDLVVVNDKLERANLSFASALVTTLDARDRYTAGHSAAVAVYARDIAERLGLPAEQQRLAHLSGLLHDIGKIGVPPGILEKNGPLTLPERRKMEEHSEIGERILANVEAYAEIATIVRHHHERLDGQGYPDGVAGESIPVISRIICVADAYNAMTSDRPYRDAMPVAVASERLVQAAGSQFDPEVVEAFVGILGQASDTYSSGSRADFALEAQAHPELVAAASAA